MKRLLPLLLLLCLLAGCRTTAPQTAPETGPEPPALSYRQISAEEATAMMDEHPDAIILDVREQDEFDSSHIPRAILLPVGSITEESAAAVIPSKDTVVLVYCRSGNRSKTASSALVQLGYSQVYEFGGIIDWPYDKESS